MARPWCGTISATWIVLHTVSLSFGFLIEDTTTATHPILNENVTPHPDNVNKTVCFDDVGCFSNIPPYDNGLGLLPLSPDELNTTFYLVTRQSRGEEEMDYLSDVSTMTSRFSPDKQTRIIVHGFTQNSSIYWMQNMKEAFLEKEDGNIILVDWQKGAEFPLYPLAVANVRVVGTQLYLLIQKLLRIGLRLQNIHCIGHSLGGHLCGHAGAMLKGKMRRITGLDVAGPEYEDVDPVVRLDPTDALFVDVIHTNAAPIFLGGLGIHQPVGHVDFYVNGGATQPGCPSVTNALGKLLQSAGTEGRRDISCSHSRAHEVFVESINTACPYTAFPCPNEEDFEDGKCTSCGERGCSNLGLRSTSSKTRGKVYLNTLSTDPYCGYHYFVNLVTNGTDTKGKVEIRLKGSKGQSPWVMATRNADNDLKADHPVGGVIVSKTDLGTIGSVSVRYTKSEGFFGLFGGKETWEWGRVEVTSRTGSQRAAICSDGRALRDGVEFEWPVDC